LSIVHRWLLGLSMLVAPVVASVAETKHDVYLQAKKHALQGNWDRVSELNAQLGSHPLQPYLQYYYLNKNFETVSEADIDAYIEKYPNSPMAKKLWRKKIAALAKAEKWATLISAYTPAEKSSIRCYYFQAMQMEGKGHAVSEQIESVWLTPKASPEACDQVFATWLNGHKHKKQLVWSRFELALASYDFELAKKIMAQMSAKQQHEAKAILQLYSKPTLITKIRFRKQHPSAEVVSYGLARLSRRDPGRGVALYKKIKKQIHFTQKQENRIVKSIALRYAFRKNSRGLHWYRKLIGQPLEPVYQEWMIRIALVKGDWQLVKEAYEGFSKEEQEKTRWRYWYARSLDQLGQKQAAQKVYASIAPLRSYHGFLASQYSDEHGISINHSQLDYAPSDKEAVLRLPAYQRAKLLYELKQPGESRLELYYLMKHSTQQQRYILTQLVADWGWTAQSLRLSKMLDHQDDVHMRFPTAYEGSIEENAKLRKLNQALVYALIRQESYFMTHAKSHAGAMGLMQLLPTTANRTAKQYKITYQGTATLLDGKRNIQIGSAHLRKLHEQLNDNTVLVIAAYNAGRDKVMRWLPANKAMPADIWIETIPYYETRKYLKNIIASFIVYQYRLGETPNLDLIMQEIKKKGA